MKDNRKNNKDITKKNPRAAGRPSFNRPVQQVGLYLYSDQVDLIIAHEPEPGQMGVSSSARAFIDELLQKAGEK